MSFLSCIGKKSRKKREKKNEPLEKDGKENGLEPEKDAVSGYSSLNYHISCDCV